MGYFYRKKSDIQRAVQYYQKEETIGKETGSLNLMENAAQNLDSLYSGMHNYERAYIYHVEYGGFLSLIRISGRSEEQDKQNLILFDKNIWNLILFIIIFTV